MLDKLNVYFVANFTQIQLNTVSSKLLLSMRSEISQIRFNAAVALSRFLSGAFCKIIPQIFTDFKLSDERTIKFGVLRAIQLSVKDMRDVRELQICLVFINFALK